MSEGKNDVNVQKKNLGGFVGFVNLPNQVHRDAISEGFQFTVMVAGESGLGKSTLLNSLFLTEVYEKGDYPGPGSDCRVAKTIEIDSTTVVLEEKGVRLNLTVVDTPGFGDIVDNTGSITPIVDYVTKQYEQYLDMESRVRRGTFTDTRVHVCLYFIPPTCHGLRPIDLRFMKALGESVNIIPIIAKSDSLNAEELVLFKRKVRENIRKNNIEVFKFSMSNEEILGDNSPIPFSVVGSNSVFEIDGQKVIGRRYPWGVVNIEDEKVSDFNLLRQLLIRTHMQSLCDHTHEVLYEKFRVLYFATMRKAGVGGDNLMETFEEEMREHEQAMLRLKERLKDMFDEKVAQKEEKLQTEAGRLKDEIARQETLNNQEKQKLEKLQKTFEEETNQYQNSQLKYKKKG